MDRGRSRYRRNSDAASEMASLPPSGYGMGLGHRQRQGSVSSLLSNRSGKDLIFGLEEFEAQNKIDLDHERAEAAVSQQLCLLARLHKLTLISHFAFCLSFRGKKTPQTV